MKVNFSISPRVLAHLGEDLIKNESIALFELIKNSYDANATECKVEFSFSNNKLNSITITDNGNGMNLDIILNHWLVIGTDNKKEKFNDLRKTDECSRTSRIPLGEKGIGRLGIHKLGNKITIITKTKEDDEIKLFIDWENLSNSKEIKDFTLELNKNDYPIFSPNISGTRILIENLKTSWENRQLREVYRNITSLNSPFSEGSDSFRVIVESNSSIFDDLPDFNDIKNSALYFGHCKMSGDEITEFKYVFKPWDSLDKVDYREITDLNPSMKKIESHKRDYINLLNSKIGSIEFDLMIFETDPQILSYSNMEKKSIQNYLKENGGIRVYRDGIRVYNYGERDNDWLGIDLRRVQRIGGNVSNNIIIGSVKINRESSDGLIEKTNREGFIENNSYFDFTEAVNYALSLFVKERNIDKHKLTALYKKNKSVEPVIYEIKNLEELVNKKVKDKESKEEILKNIYRINEQYKEVKEILIKSANAGLNIGSVIHTLEKLISQLIGFIKRNNKKKAIEISLMIDKIVTGYSAMLKKSDIKINPLSDIVQIALDNYEFRFLDHEIEVISNHVESNLNAYLARAESISVVTNLLDNAIYWVSHKGNENRKISIFITEQFKGFHSIVVSDNGPGFNLPLDVATEPFQTGKPHNIGSGLGLHVAKEMMISMKGKLLLISDKNEIDFPENIKINRATNAIVVLCFPISKQ